MTDLLLAGCRVLVVEDEYLLADDLAQELKKAGAQVIGPFGHLEQAIARAREEKRIDAALLDLNLGGVAAFPLADELAGRNVAVIFTTGYDALSIPQRYADVPTCVKPVSPSRLIAMLRGVVR